MVSIFSFTGILLIVASVVFAKKERSKPVYNPERPGGADKNSEGTDRNNVIVYRKI